jgi:hypothetical protein
LVNASPSFASLTPQARARHRFRARPLVIQPRLAAETAAILIAGQHRGVCQRREVAAAIEPLDGTTGAARVQHLDQCRASTGRSGMPAGERVGTDDNMARTISRVTLADARQAIEDEVAR